MKQDQENLNESQQILQHMQECEKLIHGCSIEKFRDLRFELKQLKEKLRLINQLKRFK
jgi:hypothetical protein